ncbi:unnamed protein product [Mytilus coruscus]|uniref:Uncharacterized protein n=1 Tax=Mytilus coruscus TaxID=42192 RepID=A0A6J8BFX9_MYTCO|nr:unnamed protein product [Mytilus coruscus]
MNRHIRTMHGLSEIENDTSGDDESQASVSSEDLDTDNDSEENHSETDSTLSDDSGDEFDEAREKGWNNTDSEEDSNDPWDVIVSQTFDTFNSKYQKEVNKLTEDGDDETDARTTVYDEFIPIFRKDIASKYLNHILWYDRMKMNPIHKKIRNTVKRRFTTN